MEKLRSNSSSRETAELVVGEEKVTRSIYRERSLTNLVRRVSETGRRQQRSTDGREINMQRGAALNSTHRQTDRQTDSECAMLTGSCTVHSSIMCCQHQHTDSCCCCCCCRPLHHCTNQPLRFTPYQQQLFYHPIGVRGLRGREGRSPEKSRRSSVEMCRVSGRDKTNT